MRLFFFFFSSRRRHTIFDCDWSSDVCSSDLTYSAAGSFTVTLTVKDNQNASSSPVSHTVQVTAPNQPPSAAFTFSCPTLACSFSDQSSDPDGSVTSWQWTFGDGTTRATTQNPSHTYSAAGSYTVTLTVTDNQTAQTSPVSH